MGFLWYFLVIFTNCICVCLFYAVLFFVFENSKLCPKDNPKFITSLNARCNKSKEESKDQESIQSSTTPHMGHHMGK